MKFCQIIGALSLGAFLLLGCEGENITEVGTKETDRSLATRVGPVSQYGELLAGQVDGIGHIYGSCKGISAGNEVQLRGMSMYWSLLDAATMFYSEAGITSIVRDMKAEVVRLAIGTMENWGGTKGYILDPEVFNEPTNQGWPLIKEYADSIVTVIRKYSDNLILVGNPNWDQRPDVAIGKEVNDPKHNVAYTFHYYAMTHGQTQMNSADRAIKAGLPIFVSEWGTGTADGKGTPGEEKNNMWQEWMDANKLSSANWSASKINEGTAAFSQEATVDALAFSEAGEMVKGFLSKNPDSYMACKAAK